MRAGPVTLVIKKGGGSGFWSSRYAHRPKSFLAVSAKKAFVIERTVSRAMQRSRLGSPVTIEVHQENGAIVVINVHPPKEKEQAPE